MSLDEVGGLVRRVLDHTDIEVADGPDPTDDYQHSFDISAASRDLGYVPRVTLEDGIRRYTAWLACQPNVEIAPT